MMMVMIQMVMMTVIQMAMMMVIQMMIVLMRYYPSLLTCQMHTDYTVSTHDILIFEKYSVVFVRCTDTNQQLDVYIVLSVVYTNCNSVVV